MTVDSFPERIAPRPDRPDPDVPGPPGSDPGLLGRRIAVALLLTFVAIVAVIVFWPGPPDPSGQVRLKEFLGNAHLHGLPFWIDFDLLQNLANVVMFLPLGLLGSLALRRHSSLIVLYAALASAAIEFTQLVLLPHRVASMEDVLANTAGALLGYLIALPALRRRQRRQRSAASGRRPARG